MHARLVPHVGVSKSGNTPRFFPDARFGTDRGPTVHAVRASDALFLGHELCARNHVIALTWRRRAEVQVVPNFGVESVVCDNADERLDSCMGARFHATAMAAVARLA